MSVLTRSRQTPAVPGADEHEGGYPSDVIVTEPPAPRVRPSRDPRPPRRSPRPAAVIDPATPAPPSTRELGWGGSRYRIPYEHNGARGLLGVGWFVVGAAAIVATGVTGSPSILAGLFGGTAALAGYQAAARWRQVGVGANRFIAAAGALAVTFAALDSTWLMGVAVLTMVVLAVADGAASRSVGHTFAAAGATVTCGLAPALAAGGMVLIAETEIYAAGCLFALICFYDAGNHVNGSERAPSEGPLWGMVSAMIVTFVLAMWHVPPFSSPVPAWVFGALAAVLCPLGQLVASAVLPSAGAPASALRRIDSLILAAPVWAWCLWSYLG